jgi:hypothetical protein
MQGTSQVLRLITVFPYKVLSLSTEALQVLLYRRVLLPMVDYFKQRDIAYGLVEFNAKKAERAKMGLQPPRGLEHEGVYFDEPWKDGVMYTRWVTLAATDRASASLSKQQYSRSTKGGVGQPQCTCTAHGTPIQRMGQLYSAWDTNTVHGAAVQRMGQP